MTARAADCAVDNRFDTLDSALSVWRHVGLVGGDVGRHLGVGGQQVVEVHDLHGRDRVLAGRRQLFARAQLGLDVQHGRLVGLQLAQQPLLDVEVADAGGRNAADGHAHGGGNSGSWLQLQQ